jgi:hypothetical protein
MMVVFASGALLSAMGTGCGSASKPFHVSDMTTLRADADDLDRFELRSRVGNITVIGDPEATEVVAEVTKVGRGTTIAEAQTALEEIEVSLSSHDGVHDVIKAEVHHPRNSYTRGWEVKWKVTAPPDIALKLRVGVGNLVVKNFDRDVEIETGVGSVRAEQIGGDVVAKTGVGDVDIRGVSCATRVISGVGTIRVKGSGGFYLRGSTGDIHLAVTEAGDGDIDVSTSVGDVVIHVPSDLHGRLTAGTSVGDVDCDLDDIPITHFRHSRNRFSGNLNSESEPTIKLSTSVGDLIVVVK